MEKLKIAIALSLLLLIVGCIQTPTGAVVKEPVKIGWIGPITGQSAVLGMDSITAAEIAVSDINSRGNIQVQLIAHDDQYNTRKAVDAYNKLVNIDKVKVIVISTYSGVFALAEKAKQDGVILMDPLDCSTDLVNLGDNVFSIATHSEGIAKVLADQAEEINAKKVGILYFNSDRFMPLMKDVFVKEFDNEIVLKQAYSAGEADFRTSLLKMVHNKVDAIVLLGYDETGLAMKQARELGFKGQFLTTGTVTSPTLQEAADGHAEGTIFAFWNADKDKEPTKSFTAKFIEKKGRPPILDLATYPTYDNVMVIAEVMSKTNNIEEIKQELLKIKDFEGVTGKVTIAPDGGARIAETPFILQQGRPVAI